MRQGTIGYSISDDREGWIETLADRLGIDLSQHGASHKVIDFALQLAVATVDNSRGAYKRHARAMELMSMADKEKVETLDVEKFPW